MHNNKMDCLMKTRSCEIPRFPKQILSVVMKPQVNRYDSSIDLISKSFKKIQYAERKIKELSQQKQQKQFLIRQSKIPTTVKPPIKRKYIPETLYPSKRVKITQCSLSKYFLKTPSQQAKKCLLTSSPPQPQTSPQNYETPQSFPTQLPVKNSKMSHNRLQTSKKHTHTAFRPDNSTKRISKGAPSKETGILTERSRQPSGMLLNIMKDLKSLIDSNQTDDVNVLGVLQKSISAIQNSPSRSPPSRRKSMGPDQTETSFEFNPRANKSYLNSNSPQSGQKNDLDKRIKVLKEMHQRLDLNFTNKYEELKEREKELKAKEAEIEKQEKAIEEQKAVWEKTLNSKLLAFKRQEQAYVQKKNKLQQERERTDSVFQDLVQREIRLKAKLSVSSSSISQEKEARRREGLQMLREDLFANAEQLEQFANWLLQKEKELEEVDTILEHERGDLEQTAEFFADLNKEMDLTSVELEEKERNLFQEERWLEEEREELKKFSQSLQELRNSLDLKDLQLQSELSTITERKQALSQYEKALELKERSLEESENTFRMRNERSRMDFSDLRPYKHGECSVLTPQSSEGSVISRYQQAFFKKCCKFSNSTQLRVGGPRSPGIGDIIVK